MRAVLVRQSNAVRIFEIAVMCFEKEEISMNKSLPKLFLASVCFVALGFQTQAAVRSKAIVIEFPSDLPEQAQGPGEAMYLQHRSDGRVVLYVEQEQGQRLTILDVTDPDDIRDIGQVALAAASSFDFIQDLADSTVLIRYRNDSRFAVVSFKNYKEPVLRSEPDYLHPARVHTYGSSGLLLVSGNPSGTSADREAHYEVLSISNLGDPKPLASVRDVIQRLDRRETGTIFLLNDRGVTVVRCLAVEQEYRVQEWQKESN
jgi:hypothetical protein